jgi:hypothetical protein
MTTVSIKDLIPLKRRYKVAKDKGLITFPYKGVILLTSYAKYLIEYLETIKK